MRRGAWLIVAALSLVGCGGSGGGPTGTTVAAPSSTAPNGATSTGKLPPGAVGPTGTAEGPAATEASPEAPAEGPKATGSLSSSDQAAISSVVSEYIAALDHHRAARVCSLIAPGAVDVSRLPRPRQGCRASLAASIGVRPRDGGPAWRRTALFDLKVEALGADRARVTATVTHHFSDRKYVSVEDDVIYLERLGGRWVLAQPSGTLYRAVGYPEPPLFALSPPPGWR